MNKANIRKSILLFDLARSKTAIDAICGKITRKEADVYYEKDIERLIEAIEKEYKDNKNLKCEEIGFEHAWKDIENNFVLATYPPTYPPKRRKCLNCWRIEEDKLIVKEHRQWVKVDG